MSPSTFRLDLVAVLDLNMAAKSSLGRLELLMFRKLYHSNRIVYVKTPYISVISFQNANVKVLYDILYRVNRTQDASEIPNVFRKSNREQQHCDR